MKRRPELLSPAGDFERFEAALRFGADAVYLAGSSFGMRAGPQNFPEEDLIKAVKEAHEKGVKVYLTLNTLPRNSEIPLLPDFIEMTASAGVDAYIAADIGTMAYCKKYAPSVPLHVSTQAGIVNYLTANEFYNMGAERIVTARELSLSEIAEIRAKTPRELQIECFVHGSMCMSFSGRCLLSNYLTGRDANRGECAQPCRWQYALMEKTREGRYFPVNEEEDGTYILNSEDMCMIEHIPELVDAGIDSFKIEGRMKTALYVATVARTYRKAIDDYLKDPALYEKNMSWYQEQISNCTYRQFTTGFFYGKPTQEAQIYDNNTYIKEYTYLGIVGETNEEGKYCISQRNKFSVGEQIEVMKPNGDNIEVTVKSIQDEEGNQMESAPHPKQILYIDLGIKLDRYDILRRKEPVTEL